MLTLGNALLAMRLHGDVGVQVVESAVSLLATVPATLVHALDLLVPTARSFMLLSAGDGDKAVNLHRMAMLAYHAPQSTKKSWLRCDRAGSSMGRLGRQDAAQDSESLTWLGRPWLAGGACGAKGMAWWFGVMGVCVWV